MQFDISQIKSVIGVVAIALTFAGYVPYIRDILKGKTEPHIYSWFLWTLVGSVAFSLQFSGGGGVGTFVTLAAVTMCSVVFLLSLFRGSSKRDITTTDTIFLVLTFIAIGVWLLAKQPVLSTILIIGIDFLCFVPTIRKSWHRPHTETASFYAINTFRFLLAAISLQKYTIVTALYPSFWFVANAIFTLVLYRRQKMVLSEEEVLH